jgi:hypothetical protein
MEAEHKALSNSTVEATWLLSFLNDSHPHPPVLWCDNVGATYLTTNPMFHALNKHLEAGFHLVRKKKAPRALLVWFVFSADPIDDAFINLVAKQMLSLGTKLNLIYCRFRSRGNFTNVSCRY